MKKWIVIGFTSMLLLVGCTSQNNEEQLPTPTQIAEATVTPETTESLKEIEEQEVISAATDEDYLQGLNVIKTEIVADDLTIELYSSATVDENGELIVDDGQEWALIARKGEVVYPLVERSYIQNGGLNYVVYTDYDEADKLHIIAENVSGAAIAYYDCTYDGTNFSRQSIFEAGNINLIGKY